MTPQPPLLSLLPPPAYYTVRRVHYLISGFYSFLLSPLLPRGDYYCQITTPTALTLLTLGHEGGGMKKRGRKREKTAARRSLLPSDSVNTLLWSATT